MDGPGILVIDWLAFSLPYPQGLDDVRDTFGTISERMRDNQPLGIKGGYTHSGDLACGGVVGWAPARPSQRVYVCLSGQALGAAVELTPALRDARSFLLQLVQRGAQFSRVDFAFDDRQRLLDMDMLAAKVDRQELVSRWRKGTATRGTLEEVGMTLAFGKRVSESYLRIYDKRAERISKGEPDPGQWVRVELEVKGKTCDEVTRRFIVGGPAEVAGILRGRLDFKEPTEDSAKCRWPSSPWWSEFLGHAERMTVQLPQVAPSLERWEAWMQRQWPRCLARHLEAEGGNLAFVQKIANDGRERLTAQDWELIERHTPRDAT